MTIIEARPCFSAKGRPTTYKLVDNNMNGSQSSSTTDIEAFVGDGTNGGSLCVPI